MIYVGRRVPTLPRSYPRLLSSQVLSTSSAIYPRNLATPLCLLLTIAIQSGGDVTTSSTPPTSSENSCLSTLICFPPHDMQIPVLSSTPEETKHRSPESSLIEFLDASPQSIYRFTAPRDAPGAEICREGRGGEDCRTMGMTGKEMFAMMQKLGFFCALPMDPTKTYMECSPSAIPKS